MVVTDSIGTTITSSITINPPEIPTTPTLNIIQPTCFVTTGKITVLTPTGIGIVYSIDGLSYQQNSIFSNLVPGSYQITAKNSLGCISNPTTAIINIPPASCLAGIFNSSTTCLGYQTGASVQTISQVCYTTRLNKIASVSPSQFIYYTIVTAPSVNFCVDVVQSKTISNFRFFGVLQRNQIYLFGSSCTRISTGTEPSSGQGRICITNAVPGTKYILSVKYDAKNITGTSFTGAAPTCKYSFESRINGVAITGSNTSINLVPNCIPTTLEVGTTIAKSMSSLIEENNETPFNVTLSANSTKGNFTLMIDGVKKDLVTIRVIDIYGRNVQRINTPGLQKIEFGKNLSQGIYMVEVVQGVNKKVVKAIKLFDR